MHESSENKIFFLLDLSTKYSFRSIEIYAFVLIVPIYQNVTNRPQEKVNPLDVARAPTAVHTHTPCCSAAWVGSGNMDDGRGRECAAAGISQISTHININRGRHSWPTGYRMRGRKKISTLPILSHSRSCPGAENRSLMLCSNKIT